MAESEKPGIMRQVMQKVSRVFNKSLMRKGSDPDFASYQGWHSIFYDFYVHGLV